MGIIPDKLIHLSVDRPASLARLQEKLTHPLVGLDEPRAEEVAERMIQEQEINMGAVLQTFGPFVYKMDCSQKSQPEVADCLKRMLRIRHRSNAPRRPPKVILIGPPGSGKSTQAQLIADAFGLVNVSPVQILNAEAEKNPPIKIKLQEVAETG